MADYPQVMSTTKLKALLELIPKVGVPDQVDRKFLQENGYTSSHDQKLLSPLKFIGLIDNKSRGASPTARWREARGDLGAALGAGLREGYAELFAKYPNAHQRDAESLTNYFRANTSQSADSARRMTETFMALCELASFEGDADNDEETPVGNGEAAERTNPKRVSPGATLIASEGVPSVVIRVELQVPSDPTGDVYEKFFKAMREHLLERLKP